MNNTHSIAWGLPFCSSSQETQTDLSLRLKVCSVGLGALSMLIGLLAVNGFTFIGKTGGWGLFSGGAFLAFIGTVIKLVKKTEKPALSKNTEIVPLTPLQQQIERIKKSKDSMILAKLDKDTMFTPTWYELQEPRGYTHCEAIDLESHQKALDTIITAAGGHRTEIARVNLYPICYKIDEKECKVNLDLTAHLNVLNNPVLSVETKGKRSIQPLSYLKTLFGKNEDYKLDFSMSHGHFIHPELPNVVFFCAKNTIQLEIGYLNVGEILGQGTSFNVTKTTISYEAPKLPLIENVNDEGSVVEIIEEN